jgi:O-antigen/teichoic acid export membrane protein
VNRNTKEQILQTGEIKKRSIKGAKWLILMNALGMPSAFLIALLLGRTGPEALGAYALVQVLIGVVTTFVVYGGSPVLSVFMPKISSAVDRGRFFSTYLVLLIAFMAVVLAIFRLYPPLFQYLLQRDFDMRDYGWFILLSVLIVATETLANTASGLMLIKVTSIARQMMRLILLPLVAVLFIFNRSLLLNHGMTWITGGFMAGYALACATCIIGIRKENRFSFQWGFYLPAGFWSFSLATMAGTVFTFLYGNFDRLAVLSIQDVAGLGMYQAVLSVNHLIDLVPQMFGGSLVPMFSSLLATGKEGAILKAYSMLQTAGSTLMTLSALLLISFSREILGLFGDGYESYVYLLVIFCVASVFRSLFFGNTPILIAYEKNYFRLLISSGQIAIQIFGTLFFVSSSGVLAIALSKLAGLMFAQAAYVNFVIRHLKEGFQIPRSYKAGVIIALIVATLRLKAWPDGLAFSCLLLICAWSAFLYFSKITPEYCYRIIKAIKDKQLHS